MSRSRTLAALAVSGLALAVPSAAQAATLLSASVGADRAVARDCHTKLRPAGTSGIARRAVTTDATGLIRVRLAGDMRGDWDLGVFEAATGRSVAGSAHFRSRELAEGYVLGGQALVVQACRRTGPGRTARLWVENVPLAREAAGKLRLVRVRVPTQAHEDLLLSLDLDLTEHGRPGFIDVLLHGDADLRRVQRTGLTFDVLVPDVAAADRRAAELLGPPDGAMPSGRVDYRREPDFGADMKKLATENPAIVKPITLALPTLEGRPVEGIEITENVNARDGKPVFLQMGVHHAREWPSAEMPMEFAFELVNKFNAKDPRVTELLSKSRVIVVPLINPDGFNLSRETVVDTYAALADVGFAYKRKNCRVVDFAIPAAGECGLDGNRSAGTDPNRNYGGFWGGPGASGSPDGDTYRGAGPFSEPETQNVQKLISSRQVATMITNHTYSDLILRPPGLQSGPTPPDEALYEKLGADMAAQNGYTNQPSYDLYDTTGTAEDWSYFATGGFGFTFEIGKGENVGQGAITGSGFHPPYPIGVVLEWFGKTPTGGGNREAYYIALESTANAERHSIIEGKGPVGSIIRLHKEFDTFTMRGAEDDSGPVRFRDVLDTTMEIPASGSFEYHANPSTRPIVVPEGRTETWALTCETPDGRVLGRAEVLVARGERKSLGDVCSSPPPAAGAQGLRLDLKIRATTLKRLLRSGLSVKATCSATCDLTGTLRLGRRTVASGRRKGAGTLRIKVSRKSAARLRRLRKGTLTLRVTARAADGRRATATRKLKLGR